MNGRGLRAGALRLIVVAAVALGVAFIAGGSRSEATPTFADGDSQSVVISGDGSAPAGPDSSPIVLFTAMDSNWA